MSATPFAKAASKLDTNNPFPPIVCKGASVRSPSDSISTISQIHSGLEILIRSMHSLV